MSTANAIGYDSDYTADEKRNIDTCLEYMKSAIALPRSLTVLTPLRPPDSLSALVSLLTGSPMTRSRPAPQR